MTRKLVLLYISSNVQQKVFYCYEHKVVKKLEEEGLIKVDWSHEDPKTVSYCHAELTKQGELELALEALSG
jgi:hypothetical protein